MSRKSYSLDFKLKVIEEAVRSKTPKKDLCVKFNIPPVHVWLICTFLVMKNEISAITNSCYNKLGYMELPICYKRV